MLIYIIFVLDHCTLVYMIFVLHHALLPSAHQVDGRVHSALVAANDNEVVPRYLGP